MANEVYEAVRTVMAVREYQDREVPEAVLRRVVEAAHLTASASKALRKLGALIRTGGYTAGAAAAIIVAYEKKNQLAVSDCSRAIQSMILTAWGDGVGSNWAGWVGMENVCREFGLPDSYDVLAVVPLGYPKRNVIGKKRRKPIGEVVSAERFGTPFA